MSGTKTRFSGWAGFLILQVTVVSIAVAATAHRYSQLQAERALPTMREKPLQVTPLYNDSRVVTDEQLRSVLHKLRPRLRHEKVEINHVDHALRFWGVEAEFDDPECLRGMELRDILLDHRKFAAVWGGKTPPLLLSGKSGIGVRTQEGAATASHYDHTLGGLAEVGTRIDHPVHTPEGDSTVRKMLEFTLREFSLNQVEYEWSTLAFALYLSPVKSWISSEGQEITFDRLADRLMRQRLNQGVCMGNHRLHTLVMLLRIDDEMSILPPAGRERIINHLSQVTRLLVASQHPHGYWIASWPSGKPPVQGREGDTENTLQNRILATGHALEWWALAPEVVHPPREVVVRAGQWLTRTILELDDEKIKQQYTFLSHAGRALALWRGNFPSHFLVSAEPRSAVSVTK